MTTDQLIEALDGLDDDGIKTIAEKAKTLQRHVDRRVSGAVDTAVAKAKEAPDEPSVEDREKLLERKEKVLSLAVERGIDPRSAFTLLGIDNDSDDADRLDAVLEYGKTAEQKTKDQILKDHTRTPRLGDLSTVTTDEHIIENPERYPPDIVDSATRRLMTEEREKRNLRSLMGGRNV